MTTLPQWKVRRLASRSLRVLDRHADKTPALSAYELTLRPAAEACVQATNALHLSTLRRQSEHREGKAAVAALARALRAWCAQVGALKVIQGFYATDYADNPDVPDDVMSDTQAFVTTVTRHVEVKTDDIPFFTPMLADLEQRLSLAEHEWREAEEARTRHAEAIGARRSAARAFMDQLIPFRRALASELGRTHPDCRALRSSRIKRELPEDPTPRFPDDELSEGELAPSRIHHESDLRESRSRGIALHPFHRR